MLDVLARVLTGHSASPTPSEPNPAGGDGPLLESGKNSEGEGFGDLVASGEEELEVASEPLLRLPDSENQQAEEVVASPLESPEEDTPDVFPVLLEKADKTEQFQQTVPPKEGERAESYLREPSKSEVSALATSASATAARGENQRAAQTGLTEQSAARPSEMAPSDSGHLLVRSGIGSSKTDRPTEQAETQIARPAKVPKVPQTQQRTENIIQADGQLGREVSPSGSLRGNADGQINLRQEEQPDGTAKTVRPEGKSAGDMPISRLAAEGPQLTPVAAPLESEENVSPRAERLNEEVSIRALHAAQIAPVPGANEAQMAGLRKVMPRDPGIVKAMEASDGRPAASIPEDAMELLAAQDKPSTVTTVQSAAANRPDLPRQVAAQMSGALTGRQSGPVEITLQPEELGRVRMVVSASETGVVINVTAERGDTADMMRRHAAMLSRELEGLGFGSVDLEFEQGSQPGQGRSDDRPGEAADFRGEESAVPWETGTTHHAVHKGLDGSKTLDIRL